MKNAELIQWIQTAYAGESTPRKREFLERHRPRELDYRQMLGMQLQYMSPQLIAAGGCALAALLAAAADFGGEGLAGTVAVLAPLAALIALTGLGNSARYGMEEIEMASRFSLRMLRVLQLAILGAAGLLVMTAAAVALRAAMGPAGGFPFALAAAPYLLTTALCMLVIRRWHSPKNIYGCALAALAVAVATMFGLDFLRECPAGAGRMVLPAALIGSVLFAAAEVRQYLKESEDYSWNLCWTA